MAQNVDNNSKRGRRYRGRTTEELSEERRQRLLEAGQRMIAREGYAQISIERVCAEAHVSTRHFYEHFRSRESLLVALFELFLQDMMRVVISSFEASGKAERDPMEQALDAVRALVRFCMEHPARARIALVETVGVSRDMERHRRQIIREFAGIVAGLADQLAKAEVIPQADYHLPAIALVGATNELLVEWLSGETRLDREQMENQIAAIYKAIIEGAIVRERRRQSRATRQS
ncbi:MAG: TetR/AcrR family transcriptional regulator [Ectothiorhodospiraceae bacterium]|nr:TetR/AcrR family transcriptional regulator [Ectothiorhodospiraceae bacterium]MCH8502769.1 TetR/AcrR family transcriptional regulator [Ectothiorhodospiraceae bacterium]